MCNRIENQHEASFSPFGQREVPVLVELALGHLSYHVTIVPPQPHSPPNCLPPRSTIKTSFDPKLTVAHVVMVVEVMVVLVVLVVVVVVAVVVVVVSAIIIGTLRGFS